MKKNKGFTLIELMIVVVALAVVLVIAVPSFLEQVRKARRSDAKQPLFDVAAKLEQYYQDNKGYSGYTLSSGNSPEGYYSIDFYVTPTTTAYELRATPVGTQRKDTKCYSFLYDNLGQKSNRNASDALINNDDCW